jgi:signal transduction histidine kinase
MLDMVADRVAHLARLVEDLLLASRVSSPASAVRMGQADLAQLVERTAEDFSTEKARLTVHTPSNPVPVECDPVRVVQVLSNLVSNGLKYSGAETPVGMTLRVVAGRGIPEDQLDRVFEKFHRVEDPLRMTTSGTGLGLFIARQLTEAMSGTLSVSSTLGSGSTFTFTLPIAVAPAPAALMPRPRTAGTGPPRPGGLLAGPNPFGRPGRPDCGPDWHPEAATPSLPAPLEP